MSNTLELEFESKFSLKHKKSGLLEPSGLALAPDGSLWTVSDGTKKLFQINTKGEPLATLEIENKGLEGITFDSEGRICVVDEEADKIIVYDPQTGGKITDQRLEDIKGFSVLAEHFKGDQNKGLEGITYDSHRSEMLLLKEAKPRLLIALTDKLDRIVSVAHLDKQNGFSDNKTKSKKLDVSGMCYDAVRDLLWIVSDKASRIFTFDRSRGHVTQSFALENGQSGKKIKKAEGVTVDLESNQLYVVSDADAELYVYRII